MKIVHLCLSNFYIDNYSYQENELVLRNVLDGHEVLVVASTETYDSKKRLNNLSHGEYIGGEGARVIRLPYRRWLPERLMKKFRFHPQVFEILTREKPDVILFHGLCGWELLTVKKYKVAHPSVKFYADSHEDFHNSARTFLSKYILHYLYYKTILRNALIAIDKILCITPETVSFVKDFYRIPEVKIELFPLGGEVLDDNQYINIRLKTRSTLELTDVDIAIVQSGKLNASKRLIDALKAFSRINNSRLKYFIAGQFTSDVESEVGDLIRKDSRIRFLGWKTPAELRDLLCSADVYVQPFGQSVTTQMSLCCRCAILLQDLPSHRFLFVNNGYLFQGNDGLFKAFDFISKNADSVVEMGERSAAYAAEKLDYKTLAKRMYV